MEYIRSCEELWSKGMYFELHAYQHHVFMDWRFVDDKRWVEVHNALNGAGVESMQAKWDEMFGVKDEVVNEVKIKKPRKKAASKKTEKAAKKTVKETKKKKISKTVDKDQP
jgi:hypothetical protein